MKLELDIQIIQLEQDNHYTKIIGNKFLIVQKNKFPKKSNQKSKIREIWLKILQDKMSQKVL